MKAFLFSAPEEDYLKHISRCEEKFDTLFLVFYHTITRIFNSPLSEDKLRKCFLMIIRFHDLGKLIKRLQALVEINKKLPSHAPIGAAYLWKVLREGLKEPLSFAVAIHHTDKGLLGDNIERPDVQAILDGIVDNSGKIDWHEGVKALPREYFCEMTEALTVNDLKDMARGLRFWAKACSIFEQHPRRLQASLAHHILKLCDDSAAFERKKYQKKDEQDYNGGRLMVERITRYVENVKQRGE